jgi:hypothetical protein
MEKPTPRINQSLLREHVGQVIRLVGKVIPVSEKKIDHRILQYVVLYYGSDG